MLALVPLRTRYVSSVSFLNDVRTHVDLQQGRIGPPSANDSANDLDRRQLPRRISLRLPHCGTSFLACSAFSSFLARSAFSASSLLISGAARAFSLVFSLTEPHQSSDLGVTAVGSRKVEAPPPADAPAHDRRASTGAVLRRQTPAIEPAILCARITLKSGTRLTAAVFQAVFAPWSGANPIFQQHVRHLGNHHFVAPPAANKAMKNAIYTNPTIPPTTTMISGSTSQHQRCGSRSAIAIHKTWPPPRALRRGSRPTRPPPPCGKAWA